MIRCLTGFFGRLGLTVNCYIVSCEVTKEAVVIDPGFNEEECEKILDEITAFDLGVKYLVNTHGHFDHINCNDMLKKATDAKILIHEDDAHLLTEPWKIMVEMLEKETVRCYQCRKDYVRIEVLENERKAYLRCPTCGILFEGVASPPADHLLRHGDVIKVGQLMLRVIHTPGHSKGSISLYLESENTVFTGDTLQANRIGGTSQPYSAPEDIIQSLRDKLMKLPEDTIVYPGHGDKTTIGDTKRQNPKIRELIQE